MTNTTSVYLGETPFTPNGSFAIGAFQTPDPDLVDVERVEVFKGPQGTLLRSQLPGRPHPDHSQGTGRRMRRSFSGSYRMGTSVVQGGDYGYDVRGSLYGPIVPGTLAFGLSGFKRQDPGFITNVATGTNDIWRRTTSTAALSSLVYRPIDAIDPQGARAVGKRATRSVNSSRRTCKAPAPRSSASATQSFADNQSIELGVSADTN